MEENGDSGNETDDDPNHNLPAYLTLRSFLTDWSLWCGVFDRADPIPLRQIGGFGLGHGRVFSMVAVRPPFTTLHNINGPHYQKRLRFFSDKTFTLYQNDLQVQWEKQRAYRVRDTAIVLTRLSAGDLSQWTVDFAPRGQGVDGTAAQNTLLRTIIIQNRGTKTLAGVKLKAATVLGSLKDGLIVETIHEDQRRLAAGFLTEEMKVAGSEKALTLCVPDIKPGEEFVCRFLLAFSQAGDAVAVFREARLFDPELLLDATYASWKAMTDHGARIVTSDRRFDDLMEGLAQTMRVQQAAGGCFAQMSEYGYNALRDMYGIARFYPLIGRTEEYRRMLDYVWQAALQNGNISADVKIDLEFESSPAEPDWENLPVLTGRTRAESPSYLILMYREYLNATSDWELLEQRYGMLRHALVHQDLRHDCLLPFSDDETFRIAMMAAFGHSVLEGYEDKFLSANSSFLFVAAAEFMERLALHLGLEEDAAEFGRLAGEVRECTEQYYWLPGGYYSPIIDIDTLLPDDRPFEDVNTKPLWLGYLEPGDEKAKTNIISLIDQLAQKEGLFYSPLAPSHALLGKLLGVREGIVTGMAPGYQLDNLARLDHPSAADAFLLYDRFFHDSGNVSEAQVVDDFGRVAYLYEPFGFLCDLTARYRSWEGSINAAAMIRYLFGLEMDAPGGRVAIAPHLPEGWTGARMEGARLGGLRFDVSVEDDGPIRRVVVDDSTGSIVVDALVSVKGTIVRVEENGERIYPTIETEWGRSRVFFPGRIVSPQEPLTIEVWR